MAVSNKLNPTTEKISYFESTMSLVATRLNNFSQTIVGDWSYTAKNDFSLAQKKSILRFLKMHCLNIISESKTALSRKRYTSYDR